MVYIIGQTGGVWPLGRIGGLEEEDVHWIDNGWVLLPEMTGSPNPYAHRHAVWHIEKRQEAWIKSEFSPHEEYLSRLPEPKYLNDVAKPAWQRNQGRDQVTTRFTLLTGSPPCGEVGDQTLYYQTQRDIQVTYQRVDGVYQEISKVILDRRVSAGSSLPVGIMTQCQ